MNMTDQQRACRALTRTISFILSSLLFSLLFDWGGSWTYWGIALALLFAALFLIGWLSVKLTPYKRNLFKPVYPKLPGEIQ
jgi:hypothetical protein